jgi:hypothetical protein
MEANEDRTKRPSRAMIAGVVASILVAVSVVVVMTQISVDPPPTSAEELKFNGFEVSKVGYEWLRAASSGTISEWLTHPDSGISDLSEFSLPESLDTISVNSVPFGSLREPQLCYLINSSDRQQHTGSVVFKVDDEGRWRVWEIRPDVDSCYVPVGPDL